MFWRQDRRRFVADRLLWGTNEYGSWQMIATHKNNIEFDSFDILKTIDCCVRILLV